MDRTCREVPVVERRPERLAREVRTREDLADEHAVEREDDRPADPVPERGDWADEGRVLPPALVRVERHTVLVREHGRELLVERHDQDRDECRDAPEQRCSPTTEVADGVAERADQEARVRKGDDEPVVPTKCLQELSILDDRLGHGVPPSTRLVRGGDRNSSHRIESIGHVRRSVLISSTGPSRLGPVRGTPITIRCDCGEQRPVALRGQLDVPDLREDVEHRQDPGRRVLGRHA